MYLSLSYPRTTECLHVRCDICNRYDNEITGGAVEGTGMVNMMKQLTACLTLAVGNKTSKRSASNETKKIFSNKKKM